MKSLLILLMLASLSASAALRTITDTLTYADGSPAAGTLTILWRSFTRASGETVPAGIRTVTVSGGAFTIQLEDNATAVEAGTSYTVRYALTKPPTGITPLTQTEYWIVPASSPLTISQIRTALVPTPTVLLTYGQFPLTGATKGELIAYGTSWGGLDVGVDGECLSADSTQTRGLKWVTCAAGGGAPTGATYITQTPHATLTAEQALSLLGTGILKNTTTTGVLSIATGADLPAHNHAASEVTSGLMALARGGTNADLSATGGAAQFLKQSSAGASVTVGTIADTDVPNTITLDNLTQITTRAIGDTSGDLAASRVDDGGAAATQALFSGAGAAAGFRAIADADVPDSITITLAATATALAANGANCSGNNFALGVDASGVGECAQPAFANLSGALAIGQTPLTTRGDLLTANVTPALARLALGAAKKALFSDGTDPVYQFSRTRSHATDCTALTDGNEGETCYEQDADTFYVCEPSAGLCDTAGEWRLTGGGAPTGAAYIVQALDATLTAERVLTAGLGISIVDGGVNGNMTVNVESATVPTYLTAFATSLNFGAITDGSCAALTFTLSGAATSDGLAPRWPSTLESGIKAGMMKVSAANTVEVSICNHSGASVDPASQTFGGTIVRSF